MSQTPHTITTERLVLKILHPKGVPLVLDYYKKNLPFFEKWLPQRSEGYYTLENLRTVLKKETHAFKMGEGYRFHIFKKGAPDEIIGDMMFSNIIRGIFQNCSVGYKIAEQAAQKGYMTEALQAGVEYIFQHIDLHRIEANIIPRNTASIRLIQKLHFKKEGLSPKMLKINGVWEDHLRFSILREDFFRSKKLTFLKKASLKFRPLQQNEPLPLALLLLAEPDEMKVCAYAQTGTLIIMEQNNALIGVYVLIKTDSEKVVELINISVAQSHQGQGLGKQLLSHAIEKARQLGYIKMVLGTGNSSIGQLAFYQKMGFRMTEIWQNHFLKNYESAIFENGLRCQDMVRLALVL